MTIDQIKWGPPPPPPTWTWHDRLLPFTKRQGEWGQLPGTFDRRILGDLRTGRFAIPDGRWEFEARSAPGTGSRRIYLWARYLGPEEG